MTFNSATLDLIKHFESLHDGDLTDVGLTPKLDPIGIWTEGYGRAMIDPRTKKFLTGINNKEYAISIKTIHNETDATIALDEDLAKYGRIAEQALSTHFWDKLNDNQKGALTSFVYNCGTGKTKYKIFANIGKYLDCQMSKEQLSTYWKSSVIKGGGKALKGLVRRRDAEQVLFFS